MANPSSSHHPDTERRRERVHHHHRTISSTTLLLVLSLILAVLAVMLSLPSSTVSGSRDAEPASNTLWGYLTPKRSQSIVARESSVALREAEVARREAELLNGLPGGLGAPIVCPACGVTETVETIRVPPPSTTIYRGVAQDELVPAEWPREINNRIQDILDRETKIAEREKEMGRREEVVNRREHDASRRESWIMEQLISLGSEPVPIEEEYIYEPAGVRRKIKVPPATAARPEL